MFWKLPKVLLPFRRLILYGLFGSSGVTLDFVVFSLLLSAGIFYQYANVVGYVCGTLLTFVLNRHFTFQILDSPIRRLVIYMAVAAVGLSVSWLLLRVLIDGFFVHPLIAKALTVIAVLAVQFTLNSVLTFRSKPIAVNPELS